MWDSRLAWGALAHRLQTRASKHMLLSSLEDLMLGFRAEALGFGEVFLAE